MTISLRSRHLNEPIVHFARTDFAALPADLTVLEALARIRAQGVGEKIIYFYVVDDKQRLVGVLPTRRLLAAEFGTPIRDLMIGRVVVIPHSASVLEACEFFVMHKFFAFPVVDDDRRIVGVVDVGLFTEEVLDLAEPERGGGDALFEALGFRLAQVREASPTLAFRFRFPWLLATIGSGLCCALITSLFAATLAESLVLAFFLTLVLGLGESVSIQSMSVTIQALRSMEPTWPWYLRTLRRELATALLLGGACGGIVGLVVWLWRGEPAAAVSIGLGILLSLGAACVFGLSIPALLHALQLDPKIAAGPVTLAVTDICTLLFYFTLAAVLL